MDLMEVMQKRRSIRKYTGESIPEDKLDKVLQAALLAPTSMNRRPCEFYAVTDRETLRALSTAKRAGAGMLADAAAAIVVTADSELADTWIEDSSIALTYMHLMAVDQGLGSCWIQMHLRQSADGNDAEDNVRKILSLPGKYRIVGILSLGIPAEDRPKQELEDLEYTRIHKIR